MPAIVTIRVEGLTQLGDRFAKLNSNMQTRSAVRAVAGAARIVKRAARSNIESSPSVRTGSLRNAVITKKLSKSQTTLTAEYIVTVRRKRTAGKKTKTKQPAAPHAIFIERGTVNMPAEPFLQPALDRNVQAAINEIKDTLTDELRREGV